MKRYAVVVANTAEEVWTGDAEHAMDACERAARDGNASVGRFFAYTGAHDGDFDIKHLVLNVYDPVIPVPANPDDVNDANLIDTYAARYVE